MKLHESYKDLVKAFGDIGKALGAISLHIHQFGIGFTSMKRRDMYLRRYRRRKPRIHDHTRRH